MRRCSTSHTTAVCGLCLRYAAFKAQLDIGISRFVVVGYVVIRCENRALDERIDPLNLNGRVVTVTSVLFWFGISI